MGQGLNRDGTLSEPSSVLCSLWKLRIRELKEQKQKKKNKEHNSFSLMFGRNVEAEPGEHQGFASSAAVVKLAPGSLPHPHTWQQASDREDGSW